MIGHPAETAGIVLESLIDRPPSDRAPQAPPSDRTSAPLVLLARGDSSMRLDQTLAAHPGARIWSLNGRHGRLDALGLTPELQFEIHAPRPINHLLHGVPAVVSPFATFLRDGETRFPLQAACSLGAPFFESTVDFMLAYAALITVHGLPSDCAPAAQPSSVILAGIDFTDVTHFHARAGASFWCGLLRGLGVPVLIPPESTILQRHEVPTRGVPRREPGPMYGQPAELAAHFVRALSDRQDRPTVLPQC